MPSQRCLEPAVFGQRPMFQRPRRHHPEHNALHRNLFRQQPTRHGQGVPRLALVRRQLVQQPLDRRPLAAASVEFPLRQLPQKAVPAVLQERVDLAIPGRRLATSVSSSSRRPGTLPRHHHGTSRRPVAGNPHGCGAIDLLTS